MKSKFLAAAILTGACMAQPAAAQMTDTDLIDGALAQAKVAMDATTMTKAKTALRRASNCLIGRDSGYFIVGAGGPCNSRKNLTTGTEDAEKRGQITDAFNKLLAASGYTDLQRAQDYAEDAIALLTEAKGEEAE